MLHWSIATYDKTENKYILKVASADVDWLATQIVCCAVVMLSVVSADQHRQVPVKQITLTYLFRIYISCPPSQLHYLHSELT